MSQDPAYLQLPPDIFSDPQQLNSYSYARSNPISFKDADGKRVEAVAKAIEQASWGTHVFLLITPDNPQEFSQQPQPANWTIGGYADQKGTTLIKAINAPSDRSVVDNGYSAPEMKLGQLKDRVTVPAPEGQSDTQFINALMGQYSQYAEDAKYDAFARKGYNSNNLVTTWLKNAGAGVKLPWGGNAPGIDPGYGTPLPNNYTKANGQVASTGYGAMSGYSGQQTSNPIYNTYLAIEARISAMAKARSQSSRK